MKILLVGLLMPKTTNRSKNPLEGTIFRLSVMADHSGIVEINDRSLCDIAHVCDWSCKIRVKFYYPMYSWSTSIQFVVNSYRFFAA